MWISRLRVNGGFLNGLDVELSPGLNVIIGPRGVGKTTLLELIRHGLGLSLPPSTRNRLSQSRATNLLAGGEVVLDLESDRERLHLVVDADGNGRRESASSVALMLGQNELEAIASDPQSRLELIDVRASVRAEPWPADDLAAATEHIAALRERIGELADDLERRSTLAEELKELRAEEDSLLRSSRFNLDASRQRLGSIERELQVLQTEQEAIAEAFDETAELGPLLRELRQVMDRTSGHSRSPAIAPLIANFVSEASRGLGQLDASHEHLHASIENVASELRDRENQLRIAAAPLRAELEKAEAGLGHLTTRIRNLEHLLSRLDVAEQHLVELEVRLMDQLDRRAAMLDERDGWQELIFRERRRVAKEISDHLDHQVVVVVEHLADVREFQDGLQKMLRSSSVQTRSTAQAIVRDVLPRQLLNLVESGDVGGLARAARITDDRASRAISHMRNPESLAMLAGQTLDDFVDFRLRDGVTTKPVDELSSGQKCAVTLPIFLTEEDRALILDQPEDHLDNAYLVSHVIKGLLRRSEVGAQTIVATHNANIPVLGGADRVFAMRSDGVRGSVAASGRFDEPAIVERITSLMEGGHEAFTRRAEFYRRFGKTP